MPLSRTVCSLYAGISYDQYAYQICNLYVDALQKDERRQKNFKNLVVWGVRGHPRSRQPFDRAYTTSYLTLWKLYVDLVKDPRVLVSSWQCPGVAVIRAGGTGEGR